MPRFYFDLHNGSGLTRDAEGQEADDLPAARALAIDNIRSILSSEVRSGALDLAGRIDIRDERGVALDRVAFAEAVDMRLPEGTEP